MNTQTPWSAGNLSLSKGPRRLLFGQMYEDAEVERRAFKGRGRVFCIASAGNTARRLAEAHEVVACDINPVQLAYAERRANGGPAENGDAERVMRFARALMFMAGWRKDVVLAFLTLSNVSEQTSFWRRHLDTQRFRAGFDALMSRVMLRAVYSTHLLSFLPLKFGPVMRKRLERGFARHANASNPYIQALLLGETIDEPRASAAKMQFVRGDAASVLESCAAGSFEGFALSNILDGAPTAYRERLARAVRRAGTDDAFVVWRSFAEASAEISTNYAESDRSMLWGVVEIRNAQTFG